MATRPRDNQQSRVIKAEAAFAKALNNPLSTRQLQTLANRIIRSSWFRKQGFAFTDIQVFTDDRRRSICHTNPSRGLLEMTLNSQDMNAVGLLHNLAHQMTPKDVASHGPEYCKAMKECVRRWISPDAKKRLAEIYMEHRVKSRVFTPEGLARLQVTAAQNRSKFVKEDLVDLLDELRSAK